MRRRHLGSCGPSCHCADCAPSGTFADAARLEFDRGAPRTGTVTFEYDYGPVYPVAPPSAFRAKAGRGVPPAADPSPEPSATPFAYDQGFNFVPRGRDLGGLGFGTMLPDYNGNILYLQMMINRFSSWLAFHTIDEDGIAGPDTLLRSQQLIAFLGGDRFLFDAVVALSSSANPYTGLVDLAAALATSLDSYANAHNLSDQAPKASKAEMAQVLTVISSAGVSTQGLDSDLTWWIVGGVVLTLGAVALLVWVPAHHRHARAYA